MPSASGRPKASSELDLRDLGDELLFYDRSGDQVHVLNGVAREIYLLCDGTRSLDEIAREIEARYDVALDTARSDVVRTVTRLRELGLVEEA